MPRTRTGRVYKRGNRWWIQYGHRGKTFRESAKSTKRKDAIDLLKKRMAEMGMGKLVGPSADRAERICRDIAAFGAEAVVISRIPGASHCALEGGLIGPIVRSRAGLPVLEVEVPPVTDSMRPALRTRFQALTEIARQRRRA